MRKLRALASLSAAWAFCAVPPTVCAQQPASPDSLVAINEAIYYFLQYDRASYEKAIALCSEVLDAEPRNHAALLFRALSSGRIGLLDREDKRSANETIADIKQVLTIRETPGLQAEIEQRIRELTERIDAGTLQGGELLIADATRKDRSRLLGRVGVFKDNTIEQLREILANEIRELENASKLEKDAYISMSADLRRLMDDLRHPQVVIRLLNVVAQTKVARIEEVEAVRIKDGETPLTRASGPVSALRASSADILNHVAQTLEALNAEIGGALTSEDAVRSRFFLGIIRFRQAIPRRAESETPFVDYRMLDKTETIMTELADNEGVPRTWRSYSALYLGLIIPFRAQREPDQIRRDAILDDALERLLQASHLDLRPGDPPTSATDTIPELVAKQRDAISRLREQEPGAPQTINDIEITVDIGAHRDTNVVLLGERTDIPRSISDERDFGFTLGTGINYTVSLSERLTLGLQGRVTQLWHVDVDQFDEQRYGGSVALQYDLMRQEGEFGPVQLRLQYDYDYTLLGRDAFLDMHRLTPNIRAFWHKRRAESALYFRYEVRDYREPLFDKRFDRDGNYFSLGALQSYRLVDMTPIYEAKGIQPWGHANDDYLRQEDPDYPARFLTPFIGLQYAWDSTQGDEFDMKAYILRGGVLVPLPWGIDLDAAFEFEWQEYSHGSLIDFHRRPRRDFIQQYSFGLSRTFVLRGGELINRFQPPIDRVLMTLRAHATFTHDDSNVQDRLGQAIFEYDRTLYGLSVAFAFN